MLSCIFSDTSVGILDALGEKWKKPINMIWTYSKKLLNTIKLHPLKMYHTYPYSALHPQILYRELMTSSRPGSGLCISEIFWNPSRSRKTTLYTTSVPDYPRHQGSAWRP